MEKREIRSLGISVILNLLIILLLPGISQVKIKDAKVNVGLVEFKEENKMIESSEKKSETASSSEERPKIMVAKPKVIEKVKKPDVVQKEVEKVVKKKPEEQPKEQPKEQVIPETTQEIKVRKVPEVPKESLESIQERIEIPDIEMESLVSLEPEKMRDNTKEEEKKATGDLHQTEEDDKEKFTMLYSDTNMVEGLPRGVKVGGLEGNIDAKWDSSNKEPEYPESAQKRGLAGTVKVKLSIGIDGKVDYLVIERGSGIPEINKAVEEVARDWKIYLMKNGTRVSGTVSIEYRFSLVSRG